MGKLLKIIFAIIGSLLGLLIVAIIVIPLLVDPNDFRDEITQVVTEKTGRSMKIEGDLSLSVFPWLGINTGAVELGNAPGFGDQAFAKIEATQIRVRLLPLLSKKLEMDTLVLSGLELNLQRNKQGRDNWSDLAGDKSANGKEKPDAAPQLAALAIGGIELDNASIQFQDAANAKSFRLTALDLSSGTLEPGQPVDISLDGKLQSSDPAIDTSIKLRTTLAADLGKQSMSLSKLTLQLGELALSGSVTLGNLLGSDPSVNGKIALASFNPRKVLPQFGISLPATADSKALQRMSLDSLLTGTLNKLQLNDLQLVVDDTLLSGKLGLHSGQRLRLLPDLSLDRIDLDRYLAPAGNTSTSGLRLINTAHAAAPSNLIPTDLLRSIDIKGSIQAGAITVNRLLTENVQLGIALESGRLQLSPVTASLYGGQYKGNIIVDASRNYGSQPLLSVDESLNGVQIGPVMQAMYDTELLVGEGDVRAKLTARGQDILALKKSLNGEIGLEVNKGALKGIDVSQIIRETYALYKGQPKPAATGEEKTEFNRLSISMQAQNGILHSQDLMIESPLPLVRGEGMIDIVSNRIDYTLKTNIDKTLATQLDLKEEYVGIPLRVNLKGDLLDPSYQIDWQRAIGRLIEKTQKKKLEEKLLDSLFGKDKKASEPAPSTQPQPAPGTQPAPAKTPEELRRERKQREKEEKKELLKGILGL